MATLSLRTWIKKIRRYCIPECNDYPRVSFGTRLGGKEGICNSACFEGHEGACLGVCDYTDRQTVDPLTDLAQNSIRTHIPDDKTVYQILSIWLFKFLSYSAHKNENRQTDRLPVDGFCAKFDRNLQIMCQDHIPNSIPVALIVFELSCSQTDRRYNSKIVFFGLGKV
ncbi:hypothetical protein AVEN_120764-1 [Araneus ventricosus]|uniref:Uncharacterized protein n=1 Tax=Araneus ventricosus TaxID=182803 RepID=A0A4Y2P1P1_ARAVE|nr:hypothetical protein AVEN_120764-1 [Araneus ventricosus]